MESGACPRLLISLVLALWIIEEASCLSSPQKPGTIYDALEMNGLPIGLLPKNVKNYTIDEEWSFEVHLDEPCYAKFENQVCYDTNIKGTLSYGQIGNLSGIVAQDLFLWFPVKGIHVDVPSSGLIYFDVGVVYKQFSLSLFENPPDCKPKADRRVESELMEGKIISDMLSKDLLDTIMLFRSTKFGSVYQKKLGNETLSGKLRFDSDNPPTKAIQ